MAKMGPVKPITQSGGGECQPREIAQPGAQPAGQVPPREGISSIAFETGSLKKLA